MYKCGTSWLTHILAAHPGLIAWREFDIIRAVYRNRHAPLQTRLYNRVLRRLGLPPRQPLQQALALRDRPDVMRELFCGRGWIPIMDPEKRAVAETLDYRDSGAFFDALLELGDYRPQPDTAPQLTPARFDNTLGVVNCRRKDMLRFIEAVRDGDDLAQVPQRYFEFLQGQCQPGTPIVLKAADQIMCLEELQKCSPRSRKIVIIRDGRDAAISALHYGKLMNRWGAPWQPRELDFHDRLRAWCTRAAALADRCRKQDILVLRYEDLHRDFHGNCSALFRQLGIAHESPLLDEIYRKTNFSAVSGGRKPGEAAESVIRKGVMGEWKSTLSAQDAERAWKAARRELEKFGYTEHGEYKASKLCSLSPAV
jgi:hypothetical protein